MSSKSFISFWDSWAFLKGQRTQYQHLDSPNWVPISQVITRELLELVVNMRKGFTWAPLGASSGCPSPFSSAHRCVASPFPAPSPFLSPLLFPSLSPWPAVSPIPSSVPPLPPGLLPPLSSHRGCHLSPPESRLHHHFGNATGGREKEKITWCVSLCLSIYLEIWSLTEMCKTWLRHMELSRWAWLPVPCWSPSVFPAASFYSVAGPPSAAGCGSEGCWLSVASLCWWALRE